MESSAPVGNGLEDRVPSALQATNLTFKYNAMGEPKLVDVNCTFAPGCRVLIVGANGAGKSTLLSIMGGKKMLPREMCKVLGKPVFHDTALNKDRMYCGDWWRTDFFFNLTVAELIGDELMSKERTQRLIDIMQINVSWRVNAISDGQRRRIQLLECLAVEKKVYILDEITTDLDLYARESLLAFLRQETEERGAAVFYATHIFDSLAQWATHFLFFSQAKVIRCCRMEDLTEYHKLIAERTRCPLYTLIKEWICLEYPQPAPVDFVASEQTPLDSQGPAVEVANLSFSYSQDTPHLDGLTFSICRGSRTLVVGANGAGKSTLLSILGGRRMIPRGLAFVFGQDAFHDTKVSNHVMYMGDWWRTNFFMNLRVSELLGNVCETDRCRHLVNVLQVNLDWKINDISDGQRRRCQLLELLATPRWLYLLDEITSDLDIFAREGLLNFLRAESEIRGVTLLYCTHIFDHLEGWATHLLYLSNATVVKNCRIDDVDEYVQLIAEQNSNPLYTLFKEWIYSEYSGKDAQPWRTSESTSDGRIPNLGLAGPFQLVSG